MLFALCGCWFPHKVGVTETGAPRYQAVEIIYDIRGNHAALASDWFRPVGEMALAGATSTTDASRWKAADLRIQYPPPNAKPGLVRATLRLSHSPPFPDAGRASLTEIVRSKFSRITFQAPGINDPSMSADDEVWVFDFSKQQLDLMLLDLARSGFFDDQRRPDGGVQLSVKIDRGETAKTWTAEPRLDDVIMRVYREGRIVGFATPGSREIAQSKLTKKLD